MVAAWPFDLQHPFRASALTFPLSPPCRGHGRVCQGARRSIDTLSIFFLLSWVFLVFSKRAPSSSSRQALDGWTGATREST